MINEKIGYYQTGFRRFHNTIEAMLEEKRTGYSLEWIFNDKLYGAIDWTVPIEVPLKELYRLRAKQLREKYDYLLLQFSGGADSTNVLHSFIDNDIFLDEISMSVPGLDRKNLNGTDRDPRNQYGEIDFEAVPHLQKYKNLLHPNTKIRFVDISTPTFDIVNKAQTPEDISLGLEPNVRMVCKSAYYNDRDTQELVDKGKKVAHILGVDKPLVHFDGTDYYSFFTDSNAYHQPMPEFTRKNMQGSYDTEFFYWTPDLPEIVVKQAQEVKRVAQLDVYTRTMLSKIRSSHIENFRDVLHPIIYPSHTHPIFQTKKGGVKLIREKESWFWENIDERNKGKYIEMIDYLGKNINERSLIGGNIAKGFKSISTTRFYKL